MLVAVFACISMPADAAVGRMAHEEVVFTFARFHTMVTVISFGTNLGTCGSGPSRRASTMAIVGSASSAVLTFAMLRAIYAVHAIRAGRLTVLALPAGSALAYSCYVVTFSVVLTVTIIRAI